MLTCYRLSAYGGFCLGLFAFVAPGARGESEAHPEMRRAIVESFRYNPELKTKNDEQPVLDLGDSVKSDPEVIILPKFEVKERRVPRGLADAIATAKPLGPQNHSKFGTGVHEKDIGKVRISAVTVLYVPIFVSLRW